MPPTQKQFPKAPPGAEECMVHLMDVAEHARRSAANFHEPKLRELLMQVAGNAEDLYWKLRSDTTGPPMFKVPDIIAEGKDNYYKRIPPSPAA